jgi:hypothetical protein
LLEVYIYSVGETCVLGTSGVERRKCITACYRTNRKLAEKLLVGLRNLNFIDFLQVLEHLTAKSD